MGTPFITLEEAREFYRDAESGHDFEHILRVLAMAERLAEEEGAEREIVRAAVLLHDVARLEEDSAKETQLDHAEMAALHARKLLRARGASEEFAERVAEAVASHRFRGAKPPRTLEAQILFDADKLDALGAIGIARAYAIGGRLNQKLYAEPEAGAVATRAQHNASHSPVAEFAVKLSKLHDRMHTRTARRIAAERHAFMVQFFEQLQAEVQGDK